MTADPRDDSSSFADTRGASESPADAAVQARLMADIAESMPGAVFQIETDAAGGRPRYRYVSARVLEVLGLAPAAILAEAAQVNQLMDADDFRRLSAAIRTAAVQRTPVEMDLRMRHPDGTPCWIRFSARCRVEGDGLLWSGYFQDVTGEMDAWQRLEKSEARLRAIVETVPGVLFQIRRDPGGVIGISYLSKGTEDLIGLPREALLRDFNAFIGAIHEEDRAIIVGSLQRAQSEQKVQTHVVRVNHTDGTLHWIKIVIAPRRQQDSGELLWDGIVVDSTELKRSEAIEAASRAKSEFMAHMSHELRTPMNSILSFAYLGRRSEDSDRQGEYFGKIESAARSLLGLVNDVLDLSKVEAGKLQLLAEPFSLPQVLDRFQSVVGQRAQDKALSFALELDPAVPLHLTGDELRLGQVLMNLGDNAVKFTPSGGVQVRVALAQPALPDRVQLAFEIRDTGIGLSAEQTARLFQPFVQADSSTTRRFGGTGLGLSICKRLVELMDGEIAVDSAPDRGSAFRFTAAFGIADGESMSVLARTVPVSERHLAGLEVLVVDDHEANLEVAHDLLVSAGVRVSLAASGAEAIDRTARQRFDAVFMDMRMPDMDGIEATRRIRAAEGRGRRTPIIALTANVMPHQVAEYTQAGMDGLIAKPIDISVLFSTIEQTLDDAEAARAAETVSRDAA